MNDEKKAERIVAHVETMRENSGEMCMWKNIRLAQECLAMLQSIDPASESAVGQALVCYAIAEQLPEYDTPRLTLDILRYGRTQLALATDEELQSQPYLKNDIEQSICRLEDYIDTDNLSVDAFREKYGRYLKFDPVERTPEWEASYCKVEEECDRLLGDVPRGMGFCYSYWATRRQVLAGRGIVWHSPRDLNPRVVFD